MKCAVCDNELPTNRDPRKIYCSRQCNSAARLARARAIRDAAERVCPQCGLSLVGRRAAIRFCSESCAQKFRRRSRRALLTCDNCAGPLGLGRHRFCSDACKMAARRHETYGLTRDELAALLAQHSVCAICGTASWGKKGPVVDHDHATGAVRGILCGHCNMGLGRFRDDRDLLAKAIAYLS